MPSRSTAPARLPSAASDPLQRRHLPPWPDIEADESVAWLPTQGPPPAVTVQTLASDAPPAWPVPATVTLVQQIERLVQMERPTAPARTTTYPDLRTYSPFGGRG